MYIRVLQLITEEYANEQVSEKHIPYLSAKDQLGLVFFDNIAHTIDDTHWTPVY